MRKATFLAAILAMLSISTPSHANPAYTQVDLTSLRQQVVPGDDAEPVMLKSLDGLWEKPILLHKGKDRSFYIAEKSIINNVVYNKNYYKHGNFFAILYISYKTKESRADVIKYIREHGDVQYPETFRYMAEWVGFDMENKTATVTKQFIIDDYGKAMTFGTDDGQKIEMKLDKKHLLYKTLAERIAALYKKSEKDPRKKGCAEISAERER
jgi:hypothetical protein